jgi:triphosphoribosyl-dephospho-CoA synthetase
MKPVVQLERTGCGIASVAALAGVSYRQAQRVANRLGIFAGDSRLWSETHHVRRLLKEYGIRSASTEVPFTKNGIVRSGIGCVWARALRACRARLEARTSSPRAHRLRSHEGEMVHSC